MWCFCGTEVTCGGNKVLVRSWTSLVVGSINYRHRPSCLIQAILCQSVAQKGSNAPNLFFFCSVCKQLAKEEGFLQAVVL